MYLLFLTKKVCCLKRLLYRIFFIATIKICATNAMSIINGASLAVQIINIIIIAKNSAKLVILNCSHNKMSDIKIGNMLININNIKCPANSI